MYGRFIGECAWKQHVCEGEDSKREKLAADFTGSSLESFQIEAKGQAFGAPLSSCHLLFKQLLDSSCHW